MIKPVPKENQPVGGIPIQGFKKGLNISVPARMLELDELAECVDFKINPGGRLESREALIKYTDTAMGGTAGNSITDIQQVTLSGTQYKLIADTTGAVSYLSTSSGITPIAITSSGVGATYITPYNDVALISDGSYLKYCDDTTGLKLCYDGGEDGTQFDNYSGQDDGAVAVSTSGVGCTFTTPAWDAGYTIPPTTVDFKIVATATSGGSITSVSIYDVAASAEAASTTFTLPIPDTADFLTASWSSTEITAELKPSTEYYCLIKGANVDLSYTTVTTGGGMITAGGTPDATKNPIMRVHPGLPPKSSFCKVSGRRPWVKDPDNPGRAYFGALTHLDWSTDDSGGYVGVIDDNANSFEIGGFDDLYGKLFVYGTQETPYLCRLEGDTPNNYTLPLMFQAAWTTHRTLINTTNDLWNGSKDGVSSLSGVQSYGDLRQSITSEPINPALGNWVDSSAFSGYHSEDGQYWLHMPVYGKTLICHTKQPVQEASGLIRYPWATYDLPITPTCFSQAGDVFLVGADDGFIYYFTDSTYKDLSTDQIEPSFRTSYVEFPGQSFDILQFMLIGAGKAGTQLSVDIYKNGLENESVHTYSLNLPISDRLTVDELTMPVEDMFFTFGASITQPFFDTNINCFSFQVKVSDIQLSGYPIYINGMNILQKGVQDQYGR